MTPAHISSSFCGFPGLMVLAPALLAVAVLDTRQLRMQAPLPQREPWPQGVSREKLTAYARSAVEGERENSCDDGQAGERDYDFDHSESIGREFLMPSECAQKIWLRAGPMRLRDKLRLWIGPKLLPERKAKLPPPVPGAHDEWFYGHVSVPRSRRLTGS